MTTRARRWTPRLPVRDMRGDVAITENAVEAAEQFLPSYRGADGDHEGIAFLLGFELGSLTVITTALAPDADHGPGHVICDERTVAAAARAAHKHQLGVLAQLHSHPRDETEHSVGDDSLIVMPFEGMLSLVAPWYGRVGLRPLHGLGIHQYQDGRWVILSVDSVREHFWTIPGGIDLR